MRRAIEVGPHGRRLAANLYRIRNARGLTTRKLAQRLSDLGRPIPASGLTRIEKGQRRVDVDDLLALASTLRVEPMQLLERDLAIEVRIGAEEPR